MKSLLFIGGTGFLGKSFFDYLRDGKLKDLNLGKIIVISRKKRSQKVIGWPSLLKVILQV